MSDIPPIVVQRAQSEHLNVHTPASYARAVEDYAKVTHQQSLYPGQSFEALARYLQTPYRRQSSLVPTEPYKITSSPVPRLQQSSIQTTGESDPFATHYELGQGSRAEARHLSSPRELELVAQACAHAPGKTGQLLILRGYPSPEWLCTLGATYDIDPDFFRRHLDFLDLSSDDVDGGGVSKLPSSVTNIFQFSLPTVGSFTGPIHARSGRMLTDTRETVESSLQRYLHRLRIGTGWKIGDSILRDYNVYALPHFSIEQKVTIQFSRLRHAPEHWIVIIFLDAGADPSSCEWPAMGVTACHLPYPHQQRNIPLKPDLWNDGKATTANLNTTPTTKWSGRSPPSTLTQSVSRLHLRYGRFLRPELMYLDPFYTLHELFSVLSAAEAQVLDVLEHNFARDSRLASQEHKDDGLYAISRARQASQAQDNLVHSRRILEFRTSNLASVCGFIEGHQRFGGSSGGGGGNHGPACASDLSHFSTFASSSSSSSWPHPMDPKQQRECDAAARLLALDFQHLHRRASQLSTRCESAMTLAMNRASIAEARRSLAQGQTLSNFTALAFVFIPLTTTASVFGMNFRELETGHLNIWLFFAVSVRLGFLCFMFLYDGWRKCGRVLKDFWAWWRNLIVTTRYKDE